MKRLCFFLFLISVSVLSSAQASDGFFKAGFALEPSEVDLADRWLVAFGSDYVMGGQVSLGYEVQTAYYQDDLGTTTLRYIPLNAYANVKYKAPFEPLRAFGGGGLGLISTFFNAEDESDYINSFGFHLVGGIELGSIEGKALILELQGQQTLGEGEDEFLWIFLAGIRF